MPACKIRSFCPKPGQVEQRWYHLDAKDQILGRVAVRIATILMGKHKPTYTPHVDVGDFVVVTNADQIRVTGRKAEVMIYPRYSHHPGGYKEIPYRTVLADHPERIIKEAVRRMLPKNTIGHAMLGKLKIYNTDSHPHAAQQPVPLSI